MLFDIRNINDQNFEAHALQLFRYQYDNVEVYKQYVDLLNVNTSSIKRLGDIPFLPISFFKTHQVIANGLVADAIFESSTTTGTTPSKHFVADTNLYRTSCIKGFKKVYGDISNWCFLALLPSYLERGHSSLIWMLNELMQLSQHPNNGFYLNEFSKLTQTVLQNEIVGQKTMVIGVSYALLDWAGTWTHQAATELSRSGVLTHTIIMETGGMKGRRKEMVKEELHNVLKQKFGVKEIHSEYGMTELLSQAYSTGDEVYRCPAWMKILTRDLNDPLNSCKTNEFGVINVTDLANQYSCAFIATDDLGRVYDNGSFKVHGRMDASEMRGCNLMIA